VAMITGSSSSRGSIACLSAATAWGYSSTASSE
jgi:hypothetical protein